MQCSFVPSSNVTRTIPFGMRRMGATTGRDTSSPVASSHDGTMSPGRSDSIGFPPTSVPAGKHSSTMINPTPLIAARRFSLARVCVLATTTSA